MRDVPHFVNQKNWKMQVKVGNIYGLGAYIWAKISKKLLISVNKDKECQEETCIQRVYMLLEHTCEPKSY